jgi:PadR family transcriptional regulator, regulatory protein PadR
VPVSMGHLEVAVLRAVQRLCGAGYGVTIRRDVNNRLDKERSFGAIYATLDGLERKGFVTSRLGDPTRERGGKPKRMYSIEALGISALNEARAEATNVWADPPGEALA